MGRRAAAPHRQCPVSREDTPDAPEPHGSSAQQRGDPYRSGSSRPWQSTHRPDIRPVAGGDPHVPWNLFANHPDPACGAAFRGKHRFAPPRADASVASQPEAALTWRPKSPDRRRRTHLRQPATALGHHGPSRGDSEGPRCPAGSTPKGLPGVDLFPAPATDSLVSVPYDEDDVCAFTRLHVPTRRVGAQRGFERGPKILVHNVAIVPQYAHRLSTE
jgi:hypothetical protein